MRENSAFLPNEFLVSSKDSSYLAAPQLWGSVSSHSSEFCLPWNHLLCPGPWLDVVPQNAADFCSREDIARSPGPLLSELGYAVELGLSSC